MDLEENFPVSEGERMLELQMFRERWKEELSGGAIKDQSDHSARGERQQLLGVFRRSDLNRKKLLHRGPNLK